jgi:RNA polymerase sigma-70 factor (ECF subfamily)
MKGFRPMSESSPSLEFWLDRLRAGDPAARNALIAHSQDRLKRLTRQMLRSFPGVRQWEQTSDVLQGVLIRIDRALHQVQIPTPRDFLRLAATQIRRELLDLVKHHFGPEGLGRNLVPPGQFESGDTPPEPVDRSADPADLAWWHEVHTRIAGLEDEDRELFDLLYYQEIERTEAAKVLEISLTTLKRRWRVARIRLMERLGGDLPF